MFGRVTQDRSGVHSGHVQFKKSHTENTVVWGPTCGGQK